ncbi:GNAT family N-acetyltransferase [Capnocytophaga ochracea]|jgi:prolyl aminopeptidase|uniref:Protease synthase and sporulation negative regulatory protein PAI 1 n=1 Tax=Capnocytophaga ochracea TaxID=1018 RepID=A0A2X2T1B5_CAPOC|nr:GNAT family N-acetyltransferase [Capnocytophaga ochracea]SQA94253.1 Protease synthase and sporulation negative regulatory protein PAI 1 [Capnocytophaga ochracea]
MNIRPVITTDIALLQAIGKQTFYETFAETNTSKDMEQYLTTSFGTAKIQQELSNPDSLFFFAEEENEVIGYLKLNFASAQTEPQDPNAMEIERIYVLKEFHGSGVGQALYQKAIEVAKERKVSYVWLGVWEKNERALRFYQKNGFVAFDAHTFVLGSDAQTDILMKLSMF